MLLGDQVIDREGNIGYVYKIGTYIYVAWETNTQTYAVAEHADAIWRVVDSPMTKAINHIEEGLRLMGCKLEVRADFDRLF